MNPRRCVARRQLDGDHLATLRTVKPLRRTVPKLRGAR